ncbi:MAG: hypothetical protein AAF518_24510, partial [Spirochaetota bacterium]
MKFWLLICLSLCIHNNLSAKRTLKKDTQIANILFPAQSVVSLDHKKQKILLSKTTTINEYLALGKTIVELLPSGKVAKLTLAKKKTILGHTFKRKDEIFFPTKNVPLGVAIYNPTTIQGIKLIQQPRMIEGKHKVYFYPSGKLKSIPVFVPFYYKGLLLGKDYQTLLHENGNLYRFTLKKEKLYQKKLLRRNTHIYLYPDGSVNWQVLAEQNQALVWSDKKQQKIKTTTEVYANPDSPNSIFQVKSFNFQIKKKFSYQKRKYQINLSWRRSYKQGGNTIHVVLKTLKKKKKEIFVSEKIQKEYKQSSIQINQTLKHVVPDRQIYRLKLQLKIYSRMNQ